LINNNFIKYSPYREARDKLELEIYYKKIHHDNLISDIAFDLIQKLCEPDPSKRLGSSINDYEDIKNHIFFNNIDWIKYEKKEIIPPYKPKIKYDGDVSNFDKMFTDMDPNSYNDKLKLISNNLSKRNYEIPNSIDGKSYENFTYVKDYMH